MEIITSTEICGMFDEHFEHRNDREKEQGEKQWVSLKDAQFYKDNYDKEYERHKKLLAFVEAVESISDNWNSLCDCPCSDGSEENHNKECMTTKIRLDYEKATNQ